MQLISLDRGKSVGEHALAIEGIHLSQQRFFDLLRLTTHQRGGGPNISQVAIVRQTPTKLSILDLPVIDIPKDKVLEIPELLNLTESPQRCAIGCDRLRERGLRVTPIA